MTHFNFKVLVIPEKGKGPILVLLDKKRADYISRLDSSRPIREQIDFVIMVALLNEVLTNGYVDTKTMFEDHMAKPGFSPEAFYNACNVIEDYLLTGGKNVRETVIKKCPMAKIKVG